MNTIYAWGYGKQVWEMLRGVSFFTQNEFYMVAIALAVMLFMLIIRFMQRGQLDWQIFLVSLIVVQLFLRPSTQTFNIIDEATGYGSTISNIPLGLGWALSLESQIEKAMLTKVENSFSTPNGVSFRNAGMGFSFIAPLEMMNANPTDKYLQLTFTHWMNNCFLYDIAQGNTDLNNIANTTDLLTNLASTVNYETLVFDTAHPDGVEQDCQTAYNTFKNRLSSEANTYLTNILPQKLNMAGSVNFASALSDTQTLIHQASTNSAKWVEQEMMRNMLDKGFKATATMTGGEVATTAWSAAVAKAATNQTWRMTGIQAKNNLPVVRAIGIALLIGVSVIVAFYAVASLSFKALFMVFAGFLTLGLWSPIAALINYQVYRRAEDALSSGFGTLTNTDAGLEQIATYAANLEWWYGAIPMISYMLITGGGMGAMYLMRDAAAGSGAGAGAGVDAAKGNINYGNTNTRNATHNEERANHQSYVDYSGDHSRIDSYGGESYSLTGTDATGGGFKSSATSSAIGGGVIDTQNAAGRSTVNYNGDGGIVDTSWDNSSITNRVSDTLSASVSQARQVRDAASQNFSEDLSYSLGEAQTNGVDIKDAQSLSNHFGVDAVTAKSTSDMVRESETKSLSDLVSKEDTAELRKKYGQEWRGEIGASGKIPLTPISVGGKVVGYSIEDKSSGESYSHKFSSQEQEQYETSFTKNLSESLSSKNGVLSQYANSVTDGTAHVDNKTKVDASKYSNAVSHLDAVTKQSDMVHSQAKENGANLNGQILQEYIKQDPTLSKKWDYATNDNQRANIISTAQTEVQQALLKPQQHQNEYAKVQSAIQTVSDNYGHQDVFDTADRNFNAYNGGGSSEIKKGYGDVQSSTVPSINGNAERSRLNTKSGDDAQNIYNNQNPHKPAIAQRNIDNPQYFSRGKRSEEDIESVVWHRTNGGNVDGSINWGEKQGYGAHYYIGRDGEIIQTGEDSDILKHAGKVKPGFEDASNAHSIGVEVAGKYNEDTKSWEPLTKAQEKSVKELSSYLSDAHNISSDKMYAHADVSWKTAGEGAEALKVAQSAAKDNHFDNAHAALKEYVDVQHARGGNFDAADPGQQTPVESFADRTAASEKVWNKASDEGLIKQAGFSGLGSSWIPGKNFDEKIKDYSIDDLRNLQTQHSQSGMTGYTMSGGLYDKISDAMSKKAAQELLNGDGTHANLVKKEHLDDISNKFMKKDS